MSCKAFSSNILLIFYFNFLFLSVLTQKGNQKNIFDETHLKHLKLKNRFFRGAVGENGFTYERIPEEIFKLYI